MGRAVLLSAIVALLVGGFFVAGTVGWRRVLWRGAAALLIAAGLAQIGLVVRRGALDPPEWDFRAFWVPARVAVSGGNFYAPDAYPPAPASAEFRREILEVGFWYPPPTMLLVAPLGWLTAERSYLAWSVLHLVGFALAVVVLARSSLPSAGGDGVVLLAALVALEPGVQSTFAHAQTHGLLLGLLALTWLHRRRAAAGVWLALGVTVKPWAAVLLLPLGRARRWSAVAAAGATAVALWILAFAAFDWHIVQSFFADPPSTRVPGYVFVESVNQSLLAAILRAQAPAQVPADGSVPLPPAYVAATLMMAAVSGLAMRRAGRTTEAVTWGIAIALGLVVYPGTLVHYSAVTPMLASLACAAAPAVRLPGAAVALLTGATYGLAQAAGGTHVLKVHAIWWIAFVLMALATPAASSGGTRPIHEDASSLPSSRRLS